MPFSATSSETKLRSKVGRAARPSSRRLPSASSGRHDVGDERERGVRVPQIVEPDALDLASLHELAERLADPIAVPRLPVRASEDEPATGVDVPEGQPVLRLLLLVCLQDTLQNSCRKSPSLNDSSDRIGPSSPAALAASLHLRSLEGVLFARRAASESTLRGTGRIRRCRPKKNQKLRRADQPLRCGPPVGRVSRSKMR